MLSISLAILIVVASVTAVGLLLVAALGPLRKKPRTVTRAFWCPFRDRAVTAEFREDAWDGTRLAVKQCSAFSPPTAITCEKRCLYLHKLPSARMKAA